MRASAVRTAIRRRFQENNMSQKARNFLAMNLIIAAAVFGCSFLRAVDNPGTVQGIVKDASGAPVAGAFVKLNSAGLRLTMMVISQAGGKYTATNLPAGKYTVQGIGGELQSQVSAALDVAAGKSVTADL